MADLLLDVRDLHAGYGRAEVLHGLNIRARPGEVITVIGPNGAGKSTLLNAVMAALPARGTVAYDGATVDLLSLEERVMLGMALVPETRALFGTMPVEDNLLLGGYRQVRLGKRDGAQALEEAYALFPRLKERRTQLAGTLSGGERQMLVLGRALMARPRLLLLDEPSLGLAPRVAARIFALLRDLRERTGLTILLVEQNARSALSVADRAIVLALGRIVASDETLDDQLRHAYLGF